MSKEREFINREIGWLGFNGQVLEEAMDADVPLMERLRFLSIVSNNLDEFFMVRVAGLKRLESEGKLNRCPAGMTPPEQLDAIAKAAHEHVKQTYECTMNDVFPLLEEKGVRFAEWEELSDAQHSLLSNQFHDTIFPILTPLSIDPSHPFPILQNLRLNLAVLLDPEKGESESRLAIVQIPVGISRFIQLPGYDNHVYVLLEEVIHRHLHTLFPGQTILDSTVFRVTRDSELDFDGDAPIFLEEVENVLHQRRTNNPVRLEVNAKIESTFLTLLKGRIGCQEQDIYLIPGPLDLNAFSEIADIKGYDSLHYKPFPPQTPPEFTNGDDVWSRIRQQDIFLHHPYDSFDPVVDLLRTAAEDPDVLAIKQTLYRTSKDSPIIGSLTKAARNGKQVCVLIELMARFDEERNIEQARRLEEAGAHVIWGIVGLKTHSKILLIVRRERTGICRYVHLGTGNYNEKTARLYSDYGLLTTQEEVGQDASNFFNALTGYSDVPSFNYFFMAPHGLREKLLSLIERETTRAKQRQRASITVKMNSLVDSKLIQALYEASSAGVQIRLNVRGICCLRPGVKGLSENIQVISIIDRFLEHPRAYHFHNGGEDEVYFSSADWMPRNLDKRVELLFPVLDRTVRKKVIDTLEIYFKDNRSARILNSDGVYVRRKPDPDEQAFRCQTYFHQAALEETKRRKKRIPLQLVPREKDGVI